MFKNISLKLILFSLVLSFSGKIFAGKPEGLTSTAWECIIAKKLKEIETSFYNQMDKNDSEKSNPDLGDKVDLKELISNFALVSGSLPNRGFMSKVLRKILKPLHKDSIENKVQGYFAGFRNHLSLYITASRGELPRLTIDKKDLDELSDYLSMYFSVKAVKFIKFGSAAYPIKLLLWPVVAPLNYFVVPLFGDVIKSIRRLIGWGLVLYLSYLVATDKVPYVSPLVKPILRGTFEAFVCLATKAVLWFKGVLWNGETVKSTGDDTFSGFWGYVGNKMFNIFGYGVKK